MSTLLDRFSELLKHSKMEYSDWKYTAVEGERPALFVTDLHLENAQFGFHPTIDDFTEDVSKGDCHKFFVNVMLNFC